jgi:cell fate regulator YaaT (PSP1 superfamily)
MREQARSLAPEVTCVSLDDCTSFLYDFPSVYSKISKSLLQTNLTIDPRKLVGLTLGLMNQVIHFEDTKQ